MSQIPDPARAEPQLTAAWERHVVAAAGGESMLLVRLVTPPPVATQRRAPVDVAFVLDRSGSMAREKLELAKQAVDVAVGYLTDADRTALVTFDHTTQVVHRAQPATARSKAALRLALPGIDAGGSTDLGSGWLTGCREISAEETAPDAGDPPRVRRALVLTDGHANVGITDPATLTHHAHQLRQRGIGTTTLGIGEGFDELLLSGMAEAGGGNFQYIARADQLPAFFARELNELLNLAALNVTLTLTAPRGVRFTLINALPHQRRGKTLTVQAGDLPAGATLDLLFQITTAPGSVGDFHALQVAATWTDPGRDQRATTSVATPALTLAAPATLAAAPVNAEVAELAALARATQSRHAALLLDRQGRFAESRQRMRQAADLLAAAPQTDQVAQDFELSESLAEMPFDVAYSEADRKQVAWENALRRRGRRHPDTPR